MNVSSISIESYKLILKRTLCSLSVSCLVKRREAEVGADNLRMRRVTGMFIHRGPGMDLRVVCRVDGVRDDMDLEGICGR